MLGGLTSGYGVSCNENVSFLAPKCMKMKAILRPWGAWGASWEGLGELFGVLGASGGGPWRGLGESWKALEAKLIKRSQLSMFWVHFWRSKMG